MWTIPAISRIQWAGSSPMPGASMTCTGMSLSGYDEDYYARSPANDPRGPLEACTVCCGATVPGSCGRLLLSYMAVAMPLPVIPFS
jgi:hypothetical protein